MRDTPLMCDPRLLSPTECERIGRLPAEERLSAARADQSRRWRKGEPLPAEAYFHSIPDLAANTEDALVVVGGELALRLELGEQPDVADYIRRFPQLAAEIPMLFVTQQALWGPADESVPELPSISGYEILSELGHGAMGVVYRARQLNLNRLVALKVLLRGMLVGSSAVSRFRSEALASARLQHPNIVQVFDVGEAVTPAGAKVPYIALELIDGPTLAEWCKGRAIAPAEAARIVWHLAEAIHVAHRAGVVHRDLKPSNVLLQKAPDGASIPKVADFGLAKLLDGTGEQTASGAILGTPAYMAPEQASGKQKVGPTADVYSLGAVLYELLTGFAPFRGETMVEVIHQVTTLDPAAPTRLKPGLARDLETVCLKCLEKEPGRRYASAAALAADLQRYLDGRPVLARPVGAVGVLWRWCRRYPAVASLTLAVVAMVLLIAIGSSVSAWQLKQSLTATQRAERQAVEELLGSRVAQADANRLSRRPGQRFETLRLLTEARQLADDIQAGDRWDHPLRDLAIAALSLPDLHVARRWSGRWPAGSMSLDVDERWSIYARSDSSGACSVRRMADDYEMASIPGRGIPTTPTLSRDGRFVAIQRNDQSAQIWSLETAPPHQLVELRDVGYARFRSDCKLFTIPRMNGVICLYDLPSGKLVSEFSAVAMTRELQAQPHPSQPLVATYSYFHDGVSICDANTGLEQARIALAGGVHSVAWSPNGRLIAISCIDRSVGLFETTTWRLVRRIVVEHRGLNIIFLAGDDRLGGYDWSSHWNVWDVATGRQLSRTLATATGLPRCHPTDGLFGITRDGEDLTALRLADGRERRQLTSSQFPIETEIHGLAIHPRGRLLAAATDRGVAMWDLATGEELPPLSIGGHHRTVHFADDGSLLTSYDYGGTWRWPVRFDAKAIDRGIMGPPEQVSEIPCSDATQSADASRMAFACRSVSASQPYAGIWLRHRDDPARPMHLEVGKDAWISRISPDGRWLVVGGFGNIGLVLYDAHDHRRIHRFEDGTGSIATFSPDGQWLVTGGNPAQLWQVEPLWKDWRKTHDLGTDVHSCAFSPNGQILALALAGGTLRLADVSTGKEIARLDAQEKLTHPFFSPDGNRLLAISGSRNVIVWDLGRIGSQSREAELDRGEPPFPTLPASESLSMERTLRLSRLGDWRHNPDLARLVDLGSSLLQRNPQSMLQSGHLLKRLGARQLAEAMFAAVLRQRPGDAEASLELGLASLDRQNWQAAEGYFAAAAQPAQLRSISELLLAATRRRLETAQPNPTEPSIERALAYGTEGFGFLDQGDWGAAIVCLEEAVLLDQGHVVALRLLSRARATAPAPWFDPTSALTEAQRALELDPSRTLPRTTIGLALLRLNRFAEARAALEAAAASSENSQVGINGYYLAVAAMKARDQSAAQKHLAAAEVLWTTLKDDRMMMPRCMSNELIAARREALTAIRPFHAESPTR